MNFNFDINKKEKILKVSLSLPPRRFAREPKRSAGYKTVIKIIDQNLDLPADLTLGSCIDPTVYFDNHSGGDCAATWTFELNQLEKKMKPKKTKKEEK